MIKRVYGHVDGVDVVFTPSDNDIWKCVIPKDIDGEYVVDLYAEDEAGNVSYAATILFEIDSKHLIFEVKSIDYTAELDCEDFAIDGMMRDFNIEVIQCEMENSNFIITCEMKNFEIDVVKCEVCGGDVYEIR